MDGAGVKFVVTEIKPGSHPTGKRKRDVNDNGPEPIAISGLDTNIRVPRSEGGAPDSKKKSLEINADTNVKRDTQYYLNCIKECKDDLAEYLEKVVPKEFNIAPTTKPNEDEVVEWDAEDNYTTRLRKTSATTFVKGFSDIKVRMACCAGQYRLVVESMLGKMGTTPAVFGDKARQDIVMDSLSKYVQILSNIVSKMP